MSTRRHQAPGTGHREQASGTGHQASGANRPTSPIPATGHWPLATGPLAYDDLLGTPYTARAWERDPETGGLDCWGLVRVVLARLGVQTPRDPAESMRAGPRGGPMFRPLAVRDRPAVGDVVRMLSIADPAGEHLGVVVRADGVNVGVLHTISGQGAVCISLETLYRARLVKELVRPLALEDRG